MSDLLRPITIRSKYQEIECRGCGAIILVDTDLPALADDPAWCDVENHEDDCQTVARFQKSLPEGI